MTKWQSAQLADAGIALHRVVPDRSRKLFHTTDGVEWAEHR